MNIDEILQRVALMLILAAICGAILTPILMVKVWLELKRFEKRHSYAMPQVEPNTTTQRSPVVTVAGKLATIKSAIDQGYNVRVQAYDFNLPSADVCRQVRVVIVGLNMEMIFDTEEALLAWEDLNRYESRINKNTVLRTSAKLEFNPDHLPLGETQT